MASFARNLFSRYNNWSTHAPYTCAFLTCLFKGSLADITAQKMLEKKESVNWQRTAAFGFFSGAYLGCGQHIWYNVWFPRFLGSSNSLQGATKYMVADSSIHTPLCYLPLYFGFENWALGGSFETGFRTYFGPEGWKTITTYWSMWPAFHFLNFRFTPVPFRIASIACFSYLWLIILSFLTHEELDDRDKSSNSKSIKDKEQ